MSKENETCENCVYDGAHSNLCDTCGDYGMSHFRADDIVSSCENCAKLEAELAKNQFNPDYDATAGALADAQEAIAELQSELAAKEALIAKHVVNGLTYADRVHGLQDELSAKDELLFAYESVRAPVNPYRWVPVSERLPEETKEDLRPQFLVFDGESVTGSLWRHYGFGWAFDTDEGDPTHWMPIPPLPKGDKI